MRVFIAITLPIGIKKKIEKAEASFKECGLDAIWVKAENIHLTFKFLGNVDEKNIPSMKKEIEETASQFNSLTLNLENFGFFPSEKRPRVFFVSTDKEEILKKISQELENRLGKIGFEKEDRFKSHITLARLKSPKNIDCLIKKIKNTKIEANFPVQEITLYKSTLTSSGPIYNKILTAGLR
ncbi:MAG: RNA 2',3'-cyclic phosphodiesterase [Candidatus Omnitrophota bacterium]